MSRGDPHLTALVETVCASELPAIVLEVPSERILAASPAALDLLAPGGGPIVDRSLEDFTADEPSGALPLLHQGRLTGYETTRLLAREGMAEPVTVWVRAADEREPPRVAVGVLSCASRPKLLPGGAGPPAPVLGATRPDLTVDRISSDVEQVLGLTAGEVLGRPLLSLVAPSYAAPLLWALAQATATGSGSSVLVELVAADGARVPCGLVLLPLQPPATCAFVLLPADRSLATPLTVDAVRAVLDQMASGADAVNVSRSLSLLQPGKQDVLSRLTSRESEVVTRLLAGDRVPAIARALFLSPSTVRNQLSAVFAKLRVGSQQELIELLRDPGPGPRPPGRHHPDE